MQESSSPSICILTAGEGTRMGAYTKFTNKALLPLKQKAIISHIIEKFPQNSNYVIATGHFSNQVEDFLDIAHPERNFEFVSISNINGSGSGPGHSLLQCANKLQKPFYFVSCDTLWDGDIQNGEEVNWLGVDMVPKEISQNYCNVLSSNSIVTGFSDKEEQDDQSQAFTGLCYVKDYHSFWKGLENAKAIKGEVQVSSGLMGLVKDHQVLTQNISWTDLGDIEKYQAELSREQDFDFTKMNEFIYFYDNRVVKFFFDSNITKNRYEKSCINQAVFPKVDRTKGNYYSYKMIEGETFYEHYEPEAFKNMLSWLDKNLWHKFSTQESTRKLKPSMETMRELCHNFYYEKTIARIKQYQEKYSDSDSVYEINGKRVLNLDLILKKVPWEDLENGIASFIHGDLQFDNILIQKDLNSFKLLDWRQDFAGETEYGDLYYDFAKLMGGIHLNYSLIKKNMFQYEEQDGIVRFELPKHENEVECRKILEQFILEGGYSLEKVKYLVGLIFLNMSPLHQYPFDKMLYHLGKHYLLELIDAE